MKKFIEVFPEWVLDKLSDSKRVNGFGKMLLITYRATDAELIRLTLNTLNIIFEEDEKYDVNAEDWIVGFEFLIVDIKKDCPTLYLRMIELNSSDIEHVWKEE